MPWQANPDEEPPTGEPCAGEPGAGLGPHARFGGRGGREPFSTPIIWHLNPPWIPAFAGMTVGKVQLLGLSCCNNTKFPLARNRPGVYAALIAHGTEIDAKSVAAMTPGLDTHHVSAAMHALETPGRLRPANEQVVDFQMKHAIAELWGSGKTVSSDMMSLDASKHLWNVRIDPRRRTYAVGVYTHVLDQHGIIYDQPIVLNERQVGPAIEGVVRYNDSAERVRLSLLAVDTHGYTNAGVAIAKLSGFDLCPRIRDLSERRLVLPRSIDVPDELDPIVV